MSTVGATAKYTIGLGIAGYTGFKTIIGDAGKKVNLLGREVKRLTDVSKRVTRFQELGKTVNATRNELRHAKGEVKRLRMQMRKTDQPSRQLEQNFARAKARANALSHTLKKQQATLLGLKGELQEAGIKTAQLGRAQAELTRKTEAAQRAQRRLGDTIRQQDRYRQKMRAHTGRLLGAVGMVYSAGRLLTAGGEVERAKGEVATMNVDEAGLDLLGKTARDLTNQFSGMTNEGIIRSAYALKSGVSSLGNEALANVTRIAAVTAKGTLSSPDEMTSLFTQGYNIFRKQYEQTAAKDVQGWGDLSKDEKDTKFFEQFSAGIAATVQGFNTTGAKMKQAFATLSADATMAGVDFAEQLAVLAMQQGTVEAGVSGTRYAAFYKNAARAGEKLGLDFVDDATGQLKRLPDMIAQLERKYGSKLEAEEEQELTKALGSDEAAKFAKSFLGKSKDMSDGIAGVAEALEMGEEIAEAMARARERGSGVALDLLGKRLGNLGELIGGAVAPATIWVANTLGEMVIGLQNLVEKFPTVATVLGTIVVAGAGLFAGFTALGVVVNAAKIGLLGLKKMFLLAGISGGGRLRHGGLRFRNPLGRLFRRKKDGKGGRGAGGGPASGGGLLGLGRGVTPVRVVNWPGGGLGDGFDGFGGGDKKSRRNRRGRGRRPAGRVKPMLGKTAGAGKTALGGKGFTKIFGRGLLKKVPGVGLMLGAGLGMQRLLRGDALGAAMELGSGAAALLPGMGTAAAVALDAAMMARDASAKAEAAPGPGRRHGDADPQKPRLVGRQPVAAKEISPLGAAVAAKPKVISFPTPGVTQAVTPGSMAKALRHGDADKQISALGAAVAAKPKVISFPTPGVTQAVTPGSMAKALRHGDADKQISALGAAVAAKPKVISFPTPGMARAVAPHSPAKALAGRLEQLAAAAADRKPPQKKYHFEIHQVVNLPPGMMRDVVEEVLEQTGARLEERIRQIVEDSEERERHVSFGYASTIL